MRFFVYKEKKDQADYDTADYGKRADSSNIFKKVGFKDITERYNILLLFM